MSPSTLTFTLVDWDVPQRVIVTAVDDNMVEAPHTGAITHGVSGGGYEGVSVPDIVVRVTDNDARVSVVESGGSTDVTEAGAGDSYTLALRARPLGEVVISVTPDAQLTVAPGTLTFTPSNWNTAQTVTIGAVDDPVLEGSHSGVISHAARGGDYDNVSIPRVVARIGDNETGRVAVFQSGGSTRVGESGATDTYTVALGVVPAGTVTIAIATDGQVSVTPAALTFTTTTWDTPQTVTVSAVDDAVVEGAGISAITHVATGGAYGAVSIPAVAATVADNDKPGVTISETGGSTEVGEGGATDAYTVVLHVAPAGPVTVIVSPDAQVAVSTTTLIFTPQTWSTAQTVLVTAVDDALVEGAHTGTIVHAASGVYVSLTLSDVAVRIVDNEPGATTTTTARVEESAVRPADGTDAVPTPATSVEPGVEPDEPQTELDVTTGVAEDGSGVPVWVLALAEGLVGALIVIAAAAVGWCLLGLDKRRSGSG